MLFVVFLVYRIAYMSLNIFGASCVSIAMIIE